MNHTKQKFIIASILLFIFSEIGFTQEVDPLDGVKIIPGISEGIYAAPDNFFFTPYINTRVNQENAERQVEVSIDANPQNPNNLVSAWIDYRANGYNPHIAFGYSFDGGETWGDGLLPLIIGGFPYQGDPIVASDKDGNFFISFISFKANPYLGGVFVAKSIDGGITWPEESLRRIDSDDIMDDKPYITIDRTNNTTANNIYVVWDYGFTLGPPPNYNYDIGFARSTNQGETFETEFDISDATRPNQLGPMLAIDATGDLYAVWYAGNQFGYRNFYFDKSTDAGQSFGTESVIITVNSYRSGIGISLIARIYSFPIIATNPVVQGHIYLTWGSRVDGPDPGQVPDSSDVLFMRSTNYGTSWSSPINILNNGLNPSLTPNDQLMPWIAVNPTGDKISVMYYDRSDFENNDSVLTKISTSIDDGISFSAPVRFADIPTYPALPSGDPEFIGDYNGMVYSSSGLVLPIWGDKRNSNWDIYTAPGDIKTVSTAVIDNWQTLSVPVVVTNYNKTTIWPTSTSDAFSFCGSGGYVEEDILANGLGYYIKFGTSQTISYAGGLLGQYEIPICEGWNIVGSISETVPISTNVCLYPEENEFTSPFYIYSNGYRITNYITAGRGHWIKVKMDGSLLVNLDPIHCEYPEFISEEEMDHFIITDSEGKNQDLYVANLDLNPSLEEYDLSMPPPIPEVGFDARFEEGEYIKPVSPDSGVVELVINIEAQEYPVTVSWELNPENGIEYSIVTEVMGKKSKGPSISPFGSTTLTTSLDSKLNLNAKATRKFVNDNLPTTYSLSQNNPNPFNPTTQINYSVVHDGLVTLKVYDMLGREIAVLVNEEKSAGTYSVNFVASNLSSGIYFYSISSGDFHQTKKMVLMK